MTVPVQDPTARAVGNGVTTVFPFGFYLLDAGDLVVSISDVQQTSGFTVSGVGNQQGGSVTFTTPPANGAVVLLERVIAPSRLNDYQQLGDFFASVVNQDFDRLWMAMQSIERLLGLLPGTISRTLQLGPSDVSGQGSYRASQNRIQDIADPVGTQDAVNLRFLLNKIAQLSTDGSGVSVLQMLANASDPTLGAKLIGYSGSTVKDTLDTFSATITDAKDRKTGMEAMLAQMTERIGNIGTLASALSAGTVKAVIWGDSIAEGISQISYDDSWAGLLERTLRQQNPNVTWNFANYSLAGRGIGATTSATYVGNSNPNVDPNVGFWYAPSLNAYPLWPTGSVAGKTWRDHVKDEAPDVIFFAMGINDGNAQVVNFAQEFENLNNYITTWAKVPTVVVLTHYIPNTSNGVFTAAQLETLFQESQATATKCVERGWTCIDIGRLYLAYRDGIDYRNVKMREERDFISYPTGWSTVTGAPSVAGGVMSAAAAFAASRDFLCRDVTIEAQWTMSNYATGTPKLSYGAPAGQPDNGYNVQLVSGNSIQLYYQATLIGSQAIPAVTNGTGVFIAVKRVGCRHDVYVNGTLRISVFHYGSYGAGYVNLRCVGTGGSINAVRLRMGVPTAISKPLFTENDLLGPVDDFLTNPASLGGNNINHPSKIGHTVMFMPAFRGLFSAIKRISEHGVGAAINRTYDATLTTAIDSNIAARVDGANGNAILWQAANGCYVAKQGKLCTGGRTVQGEAVIAGSGGNMVTTLTLGAGMWYVTGTVTMSKNAGTGVRNEMLLEAVRVG
ncbi:hypothetical protein LMG18090_04057 [Ralstonia mannitolilytica]|uniref:hypothetical protein n=1 Tax=Ralstonia mannitolilytica TaxID=105219 RepID=UPI0028F6630A|nr:hypothetical protein [Ralstonia mannitolilytica]CAJ0800864.1 hypothetical protein LMG18090_04057 [Ralstonia mannitolilytica]